MKRIPRRLFIEEFKRESIKLAPEQQLDITAEGRQLDVDPKSICDCLAQAASGTFNYT